MNNTISFEHSPFWLIACILVAVSYAYLLYRKEFKQIESPLYKYRHWLAALRFLVVFFILTLLLNPFVKHTKTEEQKPIVAILADNSESIRNGFKTKADTSLYFKKINELKDKLSSKYEVAIYSIGDQVENKDLTNLNAKTTNLSNSFETINDLYYNRNLGAVILASDGIYNQGINPLYATENVGYAIHSIALGDTTIPKDVKIETVYFNKIAYLSDQFSIKADIAATNCNGAVVNVSITEIINGQRKTIGNKQLQINSARYTQSVDFVVSADHAGVAHFVVSVSQVAGEITYTNNTKDIYVEILDGRQKILLVAASPHPDIAALRAAIESNKNYLLDVVFADEYSAKLADYSLVILHQLPSNAMLADAILTQLKAAKKPLWFITGSISNLPNFNKAQSGITILGSSSRYNDVSVVVNKDFNLFTLSDPTLSALNKWPPLDCFFGEFKANPSFKTLFSQKINNITTDFPLWGFIEENELKSAILCGEGIWRWKLYDYQQNKNNEAFFELINKTIQYLSVINDKRPFRVNSAKNVYAENEPILFDAQLYNASFEMINTTDVDLTITNEEGKKFDFKFNKNENYYTLNTGFLPSGNYQYTANTTIGAISYGANGKFSVSALQLEDARTVADHELLRQLAIAHQGKQVSLNNIDDISTELLATKALKPMLYEHLTTESGISLYWLFALIALFLCGEWFIRKWSGAY